ncbi:hypothetical protein Btru_052173 [Bulinus truncatus]|nr:hypothetical protein Btru_052173 [Bulinus truncatus]
MRADFFRLGQLSVAPLARYSQLFRPFLIAVGLPGNINALVALTSNLFGNIIPGYSKAFTGATLNSPAVNSYLDSLMTSLTDTLDSKDGQFKDGLNFGEKKLEEFLHTLPGYDNNTSSDTVNQLNPFNSMKDELNYKDNQFTNGFDSGEKKTDKLFNQSPNKDNNKPSTRPKTKLKTGKRPNSLQDGFTGALKSKNNPLGKVLNAVQDSIGEVAQTLSGRAYDVAKQQKKSLDVCLTVGGFRNSILGFLANILGDSIEQVKGGSTSNILAALGIDPELFAQFLKPSLLGDSRKFHAQFLDANEASLLGNPLLSPFNILNSFTNGAAKTWLDVWNARPDKDSLSLSWSVRLNEDEMVGTLADWTDGVLGLTLNGQSDFGVNLLKSYFGLM